MPEPVGRRSRYMPGLDGLRAIAVLGVIAYHLGFGWAPGGLLGVGVFFTLSGYLITDLLLNQVADGGVRLGAFWLARARRLLPALVLMLVIVLAWVTLIGPHQSSDFKTAAITGLFYVNNWWLIFHDVSYFAAFAKPAPLNHLWSLSVEEQFYLLWPFLIILGTRLVPQVSPTTGTRPRLALVTLGLAIVSTILMAVLFTPGLDPSRVYYGTDTRALELLVGAALAMVWPSRQLRRKIPRNASRIIDWTGIAGLLIVFLMMWRSTEFAPFLYRGGFVLLSVATAMAVAALAHPASRLGPVIGCSWMRWIGERSYGIYLWHFPIIILTTPDGARGVDLLRAAAQVAATFAVAALSWRYVENPIRHGAIGRMWAAYRAGEWPGRPVGRRVWAGAMAVAAVLGLALAGLLGARTDDATGPGDVTLAEKVVAQAPPQIERADHTSCDAVVHIGDSTSEGLMSTNYLPKPKTRISAQYAKVGATTQHFDISGGTSIFEAHGGHPNAQQVAEEFRRKRFRGCWVLALGTNEAADVAVGSNVGLDDRVDRMMQAIGGQPVLWVNVKSLVSSGPYAASNMAAWNAALLRGCTRYRNMRVYDWASDVKDDWFTTDGIHFTTPGYQARSRLIARALLEAFPAPNGAPRSNACVVHPPAPRRPARAAAVKLADSDGSAAGSTAAG